MMNTAGQVIGSEIQVATGTNVAHPQVAWVRDPLTETGRWIVGFDADQECIPGVINGYTWTVVVNFNGTVGQSNPLGWCGGMGWTGCTSEPPRKAYSTAATAESADGILGDNSACYNLQLAASMQTLFSEATAVAYQEYATWILDAYGARIDGDYYSSMGWGFSNATSIYDAPSDTSFGRLPEKENVPRLF